MENFTLVNGHIQAEQYKGQPMPGMKIDMGMQFIYKMGRQLFPATGDWVLYQNEIPFDIYNDDNFKEIYQPVEAPPADL